MKLYQVLILASFLVSISCSDKKGGSPTTEGAAAIAETETNSDATATEEIAGDDGSILSIPAGVIAAGVELKLQEGSDIANDITGAYLDLPPGTKKAGPSVNISANAEVGMEDIGKLSIEIPYDATAGLVAAQTNLVVIYQVKTADGKTKLGIIPQNMLTIGADKLGFTLLGFGNYQASVTPVFIDEPKSVEKTAEEAPIVSKAEAHPLIGKFRELCKKEEGNHYYQRSDITISEGGVITSFWAEFPDSDCTTSDYHGLATFSYTATSTEEEGLYDVELLFISSTSRYMKQSDIDQANTEADCGYTDWKLGEYKNCPAENATPQKGKWLLFENGTKLAGDADNLSDYSTRQ